MEGLARAAPGYLGHRSVRDESGLGVTLSYWRTPEDAEAFRRHPAHRAVQGQARAAWYDWYVSEVAVVRSVRTMGPQGNALLAERPAAPPDEAG